MRRTHLLFMLLSLFVILQSCKNAGDLKMGCVKARYLRQSDSPCGGPHKIQILDGWKTIQALYPGIKTIDSLIITSTVPEELRNSSKIFYFGPQKAEPKICIASVPWYVEVNMRNVSETSCP